MENNKYWVSHNEVLTDISKHSFPQEEKEGVPPLDKRYTYCLDASLIVLLQSYLILYLKESTIVDLTYHKFKINNIELNEREWIEEVIKRCDTLLEWEFLDRYNEEYNKILHSIFEIVENIMPALWW